MEYLSLIEDGKFVIGKGKPDSNFVVCSYWWGRGNLNKNSVDKLTYDAQVKRFMKSMDSLEIPYCIAEYSITGNYQIALGLRGFFISKCMDRFPGKTIVCVDTDIEWLQYPHLFNTDADLFVINWNKYSDCASHSNVQLPGAMIGFGDTKCARELLRLFNENMLGRKFRHVEDRTLSLFIERSMINVYLRIVWIPEMYMYMLLEHEYDQEAAEYTKIRSLASDLRLSESVYRPKDIVAVHRDLESAELEKVLNSRVKRNRFPPDYDRTMGKKLRCVGKRVKFIEYVNFMYSENTIKQLRREFSARSPHEIRTIKTPRQKIGEPVVYGNVSTEKYTYTVVTIQDDDATPLFLKRNSDVRVAVYSGRSTLCSLAVLHAIKTFGTPVVLVDSRVTRSVSKCTEISEYNPLVDFMTVNANVDPGESGCSDPRVLKTMNAAFSYFSNQGPSVQFVKVWYEWSRTLEDETQYQHKSLEHAFNISFAINALRCAWLSPGILPVWSVSKAYGKIPDVHLTTRAIQQCGTKPPLDDDDPVKSHYRGSRVESDRRSPLLSKFAKIFFSRARKP